MTLSMSEFLEVIRLVVRRFMSRIARWLNTVTKGRIHPNTVTLTGLVMHLPIAWLIAAQHNLWAAALLIFFGLFDTLDGELARLQHRTSNVGMLLDATTDRMKEVILYMGIASGMVSQISNKIVSFSSTTGEIRWSMIAVVAACGGSLLVSYVKAKGETAVAGKIPANEANRLFQDGLFRFEIRMVILILGLLSGLLILAVIVIALGSWYTAIERLVKISRKLSNDKD